MGKEKSHTQASQPKAGKKKTRKRGRQRGKKGRWFRNMRRNLKMQCMAVELRAKARAARDPEVRRDAPLRLEPSLAEGGYRDSKMIDCDETVKDFYRAHRRYNHLLELVDLEAKEGSSWQTYVVARQDIREGERLCCYVGKRVSTPTADCMKLGKDHYLDASTIRYDLGYFYFLDNAYDGDRSAEANFSHYLAKGAPSLGTECLANCRLLPDSKTGRVLWFWATQNINAGAELLCEPISSKLRP
jgi:hypothetical protein